MLDPKTDQSSVQMNFTQQVETSLNDFDISSSFVRINSPPLNDHNRRVELK